jgi:hypothetical protein
MRINDPDLRPLGPPNHVGGFAVCVRLGVMQCPRCGRKFQQNEFQPCEGGFRGVCDCGLDLLEATCS